MPLVAALRLAGAHRVALTSALAAILAGIWSALLAALTTIRHSLAAAEFARLAGVWGSGAFWAAVLTAVPVALTGLCLSASRRAV